MDPEIQECAMCDRELPVRQDGSLAGYICA
jgi:hypothetical protein